MHESGVALPSYTILQGKYSLRVANCNHRTVKDDFRILVDKVIELGNKLEDEMAKNELPQSSVVVKLK